VAAVAKLSGHRDHPKTVPQHVEAFQFFRFRARKGGVEMVADFVGRQRAFRGLRPRPDRCDSATAGSGSRFFTLVADRLCHVADNEELAVDPDEEQDPECEEDDGELAQ
jgi:hypothetical protein